MNTNLLVAIILLIIIIAIWIPAIIYINRVRKLSASNSKKAKEMGQGVAIGIASGVIVLVIDRIVTLVFNNFHKIDTTSGVTIFISLLDNLFSILIASGVVFLATGVILYRLLEHRK